MLRATIKGMGPVRTGPFFITFHLVISRGILEPTRFYRCMAERIDFKFTLKQSSPDEVHKARLEKSIAILKAELKKAKEQAQEPTAKKVGAETKIGIQDDIGLSRLLDGPETPPEGDVVGQLEHNIAENERALADIKKRMEINKPQK